MKVTIQLRGQLVAAGGADRFERDLAEGETLAGLIAALAGERGEAFREIVCDPGGAQRRTLLVAVDGEQALDFDAPIREGAREIALMPPIAGG